MSFLRARIASIHGKYKAACTQREKLWIFFHEERNKVDGILATEWKKMLLSLDIKISDPITMQSVSQQLFEELVVTCFAG